MNTIGVMDFLWLKLRRVPRWAWISGALVVLLVPALLMWLLLTLVGSAWQSGSALLQQQRDSLQSALPAAINDAQQAMPEATAALRQLAGAAQAEVDAAIGDAQRTLPVAADTLRQLTGAAQTEVDAAIGDAQRTLPVAADALRQLTGSAQTEVDAAAREIDNALPGMLPGAAAEAPADPTHATPTHTPKD